MCKKSEKKGRIIILYEFYQKEKSKISFLLLNLDKILAKPFFLLLI